MELTDVSLAVVRLLVVRSTEEACCALPANRGPCTRTLVHLRDTQYDRHVAKLQYLNSGSTLYTIPKKTGQHNKTNGVFIGFGWLY